MDLFLRRLSAAALIPISGWQARIPRSASAMAGFAFGLGAAVSVAAHFYLLGLALFGANRILLGVAIADARPARLAVVGRIFDIVAMASMPFAFALADPGRALAASFQLFGYAAACSGSPTKAKSSRGSAEFWFAISMILGIALACLRPDWFSVVAYVVGALGFVVAGSAIAAVLTEIDS